MRDLFFVHYKEGNIKNKKITTGL